MAPDMTNVEFARNNEELSEEFSQEFPDQNNWVVTLYFYSYLHYVEEILQKQGLASGSHSDRKDNISDCRFIDREGYKIYNTLYNISRDARYECIKIEDETVEECYNRLKKGKNNLGFTGSSGSTKYST